MGIISRAGQVATKALPFGGYGGSGGWGWSMGSIGSRYPIVRAQPGSSRDWGKVVGDGSANSIVQASVLWICRNLPQAPIVVMEEGPDGIQERVVDHDLPRLFKRPNPFFSGQLLMYGLISSFIIDGNGFLMKRRNDSGRVAELWYVPHFMMEPRWASPNSYIDWYDYIVDGTRHPVPVSDVYHLRYGLNKHNIRLGESPLNTLFQELGIDHEAANFTASILYNLGVPGLVIAPDATDPRGELSEDKRDAIKAKFKQSFGGDNRGDPIVMSRATKVTQFGFSPAELDLSQIRDIPEERVTSVLGIPASIVGFQQQNSKVGATRAEERDQAYENCIIPTQNLMAGEMTVQMLPEYAKKRSDLEKHEVAFDLSKLPVLMDARGKLAERWATLARAGVAKRKEARAANGLAVSPDDDVYIPAPGVQVITEEGEMIVAGGGRMGMLGPGGQQRQLALGPGKTAEELETKREEREAARDAALLDGFAKIASALIQNNGKKEVIPPTLGFKVVRDSSGRLAGVTRENIEMENN